MTEKKSSLSDLLKEEKLKKVIPEPIVEKEIAPASSITSDDLKTLLIGLKEEKRRQKEEIRSKATVVIPKLGDFFSVLSSSKKAVDSVSEEIIDVIDVAPSLTENPEIVDQISVVSDVIETVKETIEAIQDSSDVSVTISMVEEIQESVKLLEIRLVKEVKQLKSMIQQSTGITKTVVSHTGGGGEVLFRKLDDVNLVGLQHGDVLAWDSIQKKFINIKPPSVGSGGIVGGTQNQVLVKKTGTDFDYEWQDMIVTQQEYTKLIDDTNSTFTYIGEAVPSTEVSSPGWRIRKIMFDVYGSVDSVTFAGNGNFTNSWLSRNSLSYN